MVDDDAECSKPVRLDGRQAFSRTVCLYTPTSRERLPVPFHNVYHEFGRPDEQTEQGRSYSSSILYDRNRSIHSRVVPVTVHPRAHADSFKAALVARSGRPPQHYAHVFS